jgi:hypothetical protein
MECHNEILCIAVLNKQKCLYSKMEDKKVQQELSGVGTSGRREDMRKGCRRVNVVEIFCANVWKNETY